MSPPLAEAHSITIGTAQKAGLDGRQQPQGSHWAALSQSQLYRLITDQIPRFRARPYLADERALQQSLARGLATSLCGDFCWCAAHQPRRPARETDAKFSQAHRANLSARSHQTGRSASRRASSRPSATRACCRSAASSAAAPACTCCCRSCTPSAASSPSIRCTCRRRCASVRRPHRSLKSCAALASRRLQRAWAC